MTTDLAAERREGALAANRIRELAENPLRGNFDVDHLRAVHAYIFQDLPHHRPGEMRNNTSGWSKFRALAARMTEPQATTARTVSARHCSGACRPEQ
jgi:cell filamentation protein